MSENNEITESEKKIYAFLSASVFALGLITYLSWGLIYGSWNLFERSNLGIYAITIVLCGFGGIGFILNSGILNKSK